VYHLGKQTFDGLEHRASPQGRRTRTTLVEANTLAILIVSGLIVCPP
jgi:hypothetical protein